MELMRPEGSNKGIRERPLRRLERCRLVRSWLRGFVPPSEKELSQMPDFGGEDAEYYRRVWLREYRQGVLRSFFSGGGSSPLDSPDEFGGEHADLYRSLSNSLRRGIGFHEWLFGGEE